VFEVGCDVDFSFGVGGVYRGRLQESFPGESILCEATECLLESVSGAVLISYWILFFCDSQVGNNKYPVTLYDLSLNIIIITQSCISFIVEFLVEAYNIPIFQRSLLGEFSTGGHFKKRSLHVYTRCTV